MDERQASFCENFPFRECAQWGLAQPPRRAAFPCDGEWAMAVALLIGTFLRGYEILIVNFCCFEENLYICSGFHASRVEVPAIKAKNGWGIGRKCDNSYLHFFMDNFIATAREYSREPLALTFWKIVCNCLMHNFIQCNCRISCFRLKINNA